MEREVMKSIGLSGAHAALWVAAAVVAGPLAAQSYPAKTVRMIVPFSAGSGSDTIGRLIASR
jgi:tripartite-type tricarboxylate transporter receptor subunit TctC